MIVLLQAFWRILLLRDAPHVIPHSSVLLGGVLLLHLMSGILLLSLSLPTDAAFFSASLGTVLLVTATSLLLALFNRAPRIVQSITALAGGELLINLMGLPVNYWFEAVEKSNAAIPALLMMVLLGWNVALIAHVWRHALEVSRLQGYLYAIGFVLLSVELATLIGAPEG